MAAKKKKTAKKRPAVKLDETAYSGFDSGKDEDRTVYTFSYTTPERLAETFKSVATRKASVMIREIAEAELKLANEVADYQTPEAALLYAQAAQHFEISATLAQVNK